MNPAAQMSASLLVALGLWLPSLGATLRGDLDLPAAAVRYLLAFLLVRLAIAGISRLFVTYALASFTDAAGVIDLADGGDAEERRRDMGEEPTP
jgi:hypothetical protein